MRFGDRYCAIAQCCAIRCCVTRCCAARCCEFVVVLLGVVLYSVLCGSVLCDSVLCDSVLCFSVLRLVPMTSLARIDTKTMTIGEHSIESLTSAKNLGVTFDCELGVNMHVNNITRSCFYQLRQLRSVRRSLSTDAAKTLVHSLISSRVDYCNSIFYGATDVVVRRLQSVPNAAARLISKRRKFDHITPVLRDQLHWLPIRHRIDFKISVFVYNALHGRGPTCLSRTCNPVRKVGARAHLRSAILGDLTVPRTRTRRFGPRSFRVSGPVVWNSLPEDIRTPELSLERFKSMLKTHLFRHAYA